MLQSADGMLLFKRATRKHAKVFSELNDVNDENIKTGGSVESTKPEKLCKRMLNGNSHAFCNDKCNEGMEEELMADVVNEFNNTRNNKGIDDDQGLRRCNEDYTVLINAAQNGMSSKSDQLYKGMLNDNFQSFCNTYSYDKPNEKVVDDIAPDMASESYNSHDNKGIVDNEVIEENNEFGVVKKSVPTDKITPTRKKKCPQKPCVYCRRSLGIRRDTRYICSLCNAALCKLHSFSMYHSCI